jgi:hypothetical protein
MKGIQAAIVTSLLLLTLAVPQLTLAQAGGYSITVSPNTGRCGDPVEITVVLTTHGIYRICWDSRTPEGRITTFEAYAAGNRTIQFAIPPSAKGTYTVYLTREDYSTLAQADFEVFPSVQIDPPQGPVGTAISITGCGFAAAQNLRVLFRGEAVQTAQADPKGTWAVSYTIPSAPRGSSSLDIEVQDAAVWVVWLERYFRITPAIAVSAASGRVGQMIEVTGTGFAENERSIQVTFDGEVRAADVPADESGSWRANITVPPSQSGAHVVGASGALTRARDVESVEFIVGPGIVLEPSRAYVGDEITVQGGGFRAGEPGIRVTFAGTTVAAGITARTDGTWETSFEVPPSGWGDNSVSARGDVTTLAETALTILARIDTISPAAGAPGDHVTITGSGFHANQSLTVLFGGNTAPGNPRSDGNGSVLVTVRVPATAPGPQTVTVRDEGGASDSIAFTAREKVMNETPAAIVPKDGSRARAGEMVFRWGGITGEGITYNLEIGNEQGNIVWSRSGIEELNYTVPEDALPPGTYNWRVRAVDEFGHASEWSSPNSFKVWRVPTWAWLLVGFVVLIVLMVVAYRETKFRAVE